MASSRSQPQNQPGEAASDAVKEAFLNEWPQLVLTASSADYYFNSYNHYGVHEDVLKDSVTMSSYQRAVKQNAHLFRGAVVLDVCAGLGLCSLLAAQAGARKVIALESQSELAAVGTQVARKNGFGPERLEFVCGTAATLEALPGGLEQVDLIISEWMGYFLLYEARLGDVLCARDRWLKPGGVMFPDRAKMYVALLEDTNHAQHHFDYYGNVWGFDFSVMKVPAHSEPVVNSYDPSQILSSTTCVLDLDLARCKTADAFQMAATYQVSCRREGKANALVFWFEIRFDACHKPIAFATGPDSPVTCWKQTAFFLEGKPLAVHGGDKVRGMVAVKKVAEERRHLDIKLSSRLNSGNARVQFYRWT